MLIGYVYSFTKILPMYFSVDYYFGGFFPLFSTHWNQCKNCIPDLNFKDALLRTLKLQALKHAEILIFFKWTFTLALVKKGSYKQKQQK